jgi:hypothetical protein
MKAMCNGFSFIDALVFFVEHEGRCRRPIDHHVLMMATASRIEFHGTHAVASVTRPTASRTLDCTILLPEYHPTRKSGKPRRGSAAAKYTGSSNGGGRKTLAFSRACSGRQIDGAFPVAFGTTLRKDL